MPTRQYSAMIIGGAWPHTDPESFQTASEAQHTKGVDLINCAESVRSTAASVVGEESGDAVDGFGEACHKEAATYTDQADTFFALSRMCDECARLIYGLREDLDEIDSDAHRAIDQVMQWVQSGVMDAMVGGVEIMQIVAQARAAAMAKAAEVDGKLIAEAAKVGIDAKPPAASTSTGGASPDGDTWKLPENAGFGGGPGPGGLRGGLPTGKPNLGDLPQDVPPGKEPPLTGEHQQNPDGGKGDGATPGSGDPANPDKPSGDAANSGLDEHGSADPHSSGHQRDGTATGGLPSNLPAPPVSLGGSSSSPSASPVSSTGGMGGGFKMPSAPSGLGTGGGLPTQGLGSSGGLGSGGLGSGGLPGAGGSAPSMSAPSAPSSDFSRGFNAGLGGGPAAFAPPVPPPASTAAGSAGASGAVPAGPAPVSAAAGSAAATPAAAPSSFGPSGGSVGGGGGPSAPMGPLPPFGSDVPRTPSPTAAVSPAAGPPASVPAPAAGGTSAGPVAALPPGVVGSGVGASAGAAMEGIRSSLPDPLLASASQLLYQLLHDSRMYPYMDWCVGVFRTSSGIETLIVNSEGAGFIPAGVFVPRSARMLFADGGLSTEFRARWFSYANPAETMLAYAELAAEHRPDIDLWALAVSTDDGGTSMPARSIIQHFEECSRMASPLGDGAPVSRLDDVHSHRLETLDRALYSRLTGFGDGPLPDRSEAWRTTVSAAQMALGRAGSIPDLAVTPAIREVLDLLGQGLPVPSLRWQELEAAHIGVVMAGAGLRPGRMAAYPGAGAHVLANHDLARLIELLLLWRLDSIAYPEIAYLAGQISFTPWMAGVS
ncbi:putative methyl-accepting chemotaxis sensory transducer [uncultured Mycobacterium sp.]|uniref:Putative methyl-accepting chemotaxis sensory transducer n=1 Tax=uncultured Mycobacterium sp. TaxID=171292 RepID=A0A1Y5PH17_9MYCO|nr:putative methyl-accepting chemotaxis sensory transducer [uncultured Mycobacterium sp.]